MRRSWLVLVLFASALAGCVTSEDGLTAKDAEARAHERAVAWQGDAELLGIVGREGRDVGGPLGAEPLRAADGRVGDGRAPAWGLVYQSRDANSTLRVTVSSSAVTEEDARGEGLGQPGVQGWEVDSPRLVQILRSNSDVGPLLDAPDVVLVVSLAMSPGRQDPTWNFEASSTSARRSTDGEVNARTGDLLVVQPSDVGAQQDPAEVRVEGTVSPENPERTEPFDVGLAATGLGVEFTAEGNLPSDAASYEILGPDGRTLGQGQSQGGQTSRDAFPSAGPGTYRAVVRFQTAAAGLGMGLQRTDFVLVLRIGADWAGNPVLVPWSEYSN